MPALAPCPDTPNCVSSLAEDVAHAVEPLSFAGPYEPVMIRLREIIESMPGARVTAVEDLYLQAVFRSLVFRFADDLELLVDPEASVVHVRSASRVGSWDLGANRRRVEKLRARFRERTD